MYRIGSFPATSSLSCTLLTLPVAVGMAPTGRPRTDPGMRHYRTRLWSWVITSPLDDVFTSASPLRHFQPPGCTGCLLHDLLVVITTGFAPASQR